MEPGCTPQMGAHIYVQHGCHIDCLLGSTPCGGGGGTLIFSYIRRLGSFFGFKILNFNIFGGFSEK